MAKPRRAWLIWLIVSAFVVLVGAVGVFVIFGMQNPGLANADSGLGLPRPLQPNEGPQQIQKH